MAQITLKNLSCGYDNKPIIHNLNIDINKGDYIVIVGENGAGKSTLIKTILGLLPAVSGNVLFKGGFTRKNIGYLPQQTLTQKDFPATVMEVVMSGFQNRHKIFSFYTTEEKNIAKNNLKKLEISDLANRCYRELSGGQQQRVLIARALCSAQNMLILDEPTSGLDATSTEEMYALIKQLNNDGITILMISHDIGSALKYASHIMFVKEDVFYDTKDNFLKSPLGKKYNHFVGGHIGGHSHEQHI